MTGAIAKRIQGLFEDAEVTLGRIESRSWGCIVSIDVENVSGDPAQIFMRTTRATSRNIGVDEHYVDQNVVRVTCRDVESGTIHACGRHTMGENNDESHHAYFHGVVALEHHEDGGEAQACAEIDRLHHEEVVDGAREMLGRILELVGPLPASAVKPLIGSIEGRRMMRLMAAGA